ncbi:MAG: hypothetical protein ACP5IE_03360 [Infirmifilum sp.]
MCNSSPDIEVSDSVTVSAGSVVRKTYQIPDKVEVQFIAYISGGLGNDADIKIYAPDGNMIVADRQSSAFTYKFVTPEDGQQ